MRIAPVSRVLTFTNVLPRTLKHGLPYDVDFSALGSADAMRRTSSHVATRAG